ncbi:hypothetical protein Pfo_004473 [Paulownia fortunei]|nr:hypothetical protein Pfo_004473 [Paulownia fortunei]
MKSLNPSSENCRRNGVIGLGLVPGHGPPTINIKVSHGLSQYEVAVPSNSSFGYLKSVISQKIGLKPEMNKLFFRGKETEDDEDLQTAGVKDNSEVVLMEDKACEQKSPEVLQETCVISKGDAAVAEVRKEVDKLAQQVSALQAAVDSGTKVDDKEIIYLSEMLMRQLLKLDGIEAEGEGKVKRKMEVRRVQSIVETLDVLKSRNSNAFSNAHKSVSVTTQWEAFSPCESVNASLPMPSTAPYSMPSFAPSPMSYFTSSTVPSSTPSPVPYYVPSPLPPSAPFPMPYYVPSPMPPSAPFPMPSSSKVTQNWEHFG